MNLNTKIAETWHRYEIILRDYILSLRDVRNVGMLVFVMIILLVSWSGIKSIQTNFQLEQEVQKLARRNEVLKLQTSNQALQNDYYTTSQYLEITARQNLGLAASGETELLVPKDIALSHALPLPGEAEANAAKSKPMWQANFESWMNFFFHRPQSS